MSESTTNIFLDHIGVLKDDVCGETKDIQAGINAITSTNHLLVAKSEYTYFELDFHLA